MERRVWGAASDRHLDFLVTAQAWPAGRGRVEGAVAVAVARIAELGDVDEVLCRAGTPVSAYLVVSWSV
jgi:hypothetical protein